MKEFMVFLAILSAIMYGLGYQASQCHKRSCPVSMTPKVIESHCLCVTEAK